MKVCVFGLWHQGTVTSAGLATLGHQVVGLDFDQERIQGLQKAQAPLLEPGLNELISKQTQSGRLSFSCNAREALKKAQVLWFAFDTPTNDKDMADIKFLKNNFNKIMPYLTDGMGIIISSQAPAGFIRKIEKTFKKQYPEKCVYFASSPENLKIGRALDAFLNPDRIIIGIRDQASKDIFNPLFTSITDRLEWMTVESAEMTKHAINSFLAMSVCFTNEIAGICEQAGADAREVERGLKTESRIGPRAYLSPGVAFSGGTLARDLNFLVKLSDAYELPAHLLKSIHKSNLFHKQWIERKVLSAFGKFKKKTVAILTLAYKPGIDTLHRSFALELAESFHAHGARVIGFDPIIKNIPKHLSKVIELKKSIAEAIGPADVIVIATQWPGFLHLGKDIIELMKDKIIVDPNGYMAKLIEHKVLNYVSVGKNSMGVGKK